jgi:hypothetical protein
MNELFDAVKRHLAAQADSKAALALWAELVTAYQQEGSEGLERHIEGLLDRPDDAEDEEP